jgi:hypothetical protein
MIPMAMRKKEMIEHDLPLFDKGLYLSTKAARVNKDSNSGFGVSHQKTVDSVAPHGKTPEYQIGHHHTIQKNMKNQKIEARITKQIRIA